MGECANCLQEEDDVVCAKCSDAPALREEVFELRKSLSALSGAAYDVVKANSTLEMGGRKYRNPTIKKLADAMYAANAHFHDVEDRTSEATPDDPLRAVANAARTAHFGLMLDELEVEHNGPIMDRLGEALAAVFGNGAGSEVERVSAEARPLVYACVTCERPVHSHSMQCESCERAFNAGREYERTHGRERATDERLDAARERVIAAARALDTSAAGQPTVEALDKALVNLDCVEAARRNP